ncbi:ParB family protein [Sphingomonas guangdongensis]|jgi:ParB family chromosome partitioning protein|uniref:ParB family protein n=1 Tax=Sphingomonas guangdongensis TaxID=1141890 RepID=A0A285R1Q3_9SPHN|nr:ParB/RepB/Spo0J family partition protein [Sphingomonas guangdongensis]GLK22322.1 chromosome partitioning protein ParB [Microbacterium terregens]SOB88033.1 ParB family protein [Sphingomonas guangdongensis]
MIQTIPLAKLVPSKRNVRRRSDAAADAQLRADIEARGLLQNLIVTANKKPRGTFAVEAGGRRHAALKALAEEGKLAADFAVPCLVLDDLGSAVAEASLAENFQKLALNPADECLAFQHFIEQGSDVDGVARRFGVTVRFVEGRLRLASLAPVVFQALADGVITLDIAKAYASTPDRERQAHVFDQMSRGYGGAHPDSIRRMMTQATVSAADPRARLVGEDAYLAAGGRIDRDLFADDTSTRWLDIAILERLANEKMDEAAATLAAETGYAWIRPTLDRYVDWQQTEGLERVELEPAALTDSEQEQVATLEAQAADKIALLEDEASSDEDRAQAEVELETIEKAVEAITDKPPVLDEALRPQIGAFLVLGPDGTPRLHQTLYVERTPQEENGPDDADHEAGEPAPRAVGLSQRLTDELAIQRRDILAVHVAADPDFALDLAIFLMVDRKPGHGVERYGSSLSARPPQEPVIGLKTPEAPATLARVEAGQALDRGWTTLDSAEARFDAFRALGPDERAAWLGHAVADSLEASVAGTGTGGCRFHDHLGHLLDIDVAAWWRPTAANFFDKVTKPVMFDALVEIDGPALAARYGNAKKADLAAACEKICAGDFIGEVSTKQAARAWLPAAMRFAPELARQAEGDPATLPDEADASATELDHASDVIDRDAA